MKTYLKTGRLAVVVIIAMCATWAASAAHAQTANAQTKSAQTKPVEGRVEAGRSLALLACTGCHIVTPDQPFKPVYSGPPYPPNFKQIADGSKVTAASLRQHLESLPAVPTTKPQMPNPMLSSQELQDVTAFIISLRNEPAAPAH